MGEGHIRHLSIEFRAEQAAAGSTWIHLVHSVLSCPGALTRTVTCERASIHPCPVHPASAPDANTEAAQVGPTWAGDGTVGLSPDFKARDGPERLVGFDQVALRVLAFEAFFLLEGLCVQDGPPQALKSRHFMLR